MGYDIPGEKRYWDKVWKVLDEASIVNGRMKCVGIEDVEVDMDWADSSSSSFSFFFFLGTLISIFY